MSKTTLLDEELTYEQAFAELEEIISALETGEHTLDEAIAKYERGQALARFCARLLDKAELKVQQLSGDEIIGFEGWPFSVFGLQSPCLWYTPGAQNILEVKNVRYRIDLLCSLTLYIQSR